MSFEFAATLAISAVVLAAGVVTVVCRRRIARNASAIGASGRGMSTPRSAGLVGAFMIGIAILGPLIVLWINPGMATSWPGSGLPIR
ncbi:hypothetical protein LJR045_000296 [Microbacterium sp. LjRoot45]|uniref:hypothetical protein n=1 Tax=Microbacterium sp. LjRoot45 TaxID=3342329 RepID=UPI003ECDD0CB